MRVALALVILASALVIVCAAFPQRILTVDSGPVKADVLIVLGGGAHERPERAAELLKTGEARRVIISGLGDAEINRRILVAGGVPSNAIQIEPNSRTTKENAQFTIQLLRAQKVHSAIIVTSWYHSRRALDCFRHYAPEIQFYSRPSYFGFKRSDWTRLLEKRIYLEYLKLGGYCLRYGVSPFLE